MALNLNFGNRDIVQTIAKSFQQSVPPKKRTLHEQFIEALNCYILLHKYQAEKKKMGSILATLTGSQPSNIKAAEKLLHVISGKSAPAFSSDELLALRQGELGQLLKTYNGELPNDLKTRLTGIVSQPNPVDKKPIRTQAKTLWKQQIKYRLKQGKKVAFLYAGNDLQAKALVAGYQTKLHGKALQNVFKGGTGQAQLFSELSRFVDSPQKADQFRILPGATSLTDNPNSTGDETKANIDNYFQLIAWHLGNGWDVVGLSNQNGFEMSGDESGNWYKTNPIYLLQDNKTGSYTLHVDGGSNNQSDNASNKSKPMNVSEWMVWGSIILTFLISILIVTVPPLGLAVAGLGASIAGFFGLALAAESILCSAIGSFVVGAAAVAAYDLIIGGVALIKDVLVPSLRKTEEPHRISPGEYVQSKLTMLSEQPISQWPQPLQDAYKQGEKAKTLGAKLPDASPSPQPQPAPNAAAAKPTRQIPPAHATKETATSFSLFKTPASSTQEAFIPVVSQSSRL
jgi:hypothetical protein